MIGVAGMHVLKDFPPGDDFVGDIARRLARRVAERNEAIARWGLRIYMNTDWCARPLWFRCIQGPERPGLITAPHCKLVLRYRWPS